MGRAHELMLMGRAHEPMLMGRAHEHMLMGRAHEHMLMGRAHEHRLMEPFKFMKIESNWVHMPLFGLKLRLNESPG